MATFVPPQDRKFQSPHLPFGDHRDAPFYGNDIISVSQFTRSDIEYIFGVAKEMRAMVERVGTFDLLKGKILANLFYDFRMLSWPPNPLQSQREWHLRWFRSGIRNRKRAKYCPY